MSERPVRVAILGGGCAGMATAFELTRPEHHGKYQVTVYQVGWRLGGKGASGRGEAQRIEEHGLHLWMGFYENAFLLMRQCYGELARDPARCRIADWRDAFIPDPINGLADRSPGGAWLPWMVSMPQFPGLPGDEDGAARRWTVADYLARSLTLVRSLVDAVRLRAPGGSEPTAPSSDEPASYVDQATRLLRFGRLATLASVVEAIRLMELALGAAVPGMPDSLLLRLQAGVVDALRGQVEALTREDDEARRLWEIADLVLALVRGSVRFGLMADPRGFDAIDDYDCREWLQMNGASERSINSAFIRALYDLAFAYEEGDVRRPRIAAGQAVRGALRAFFTYRGAFFWKMRSGMGDVVFAPFYEALSRRGVRFEFFHRLRNLQLSPSDDSGARPHITALDFDVQAHIKGGGAYRPLVDVRGLPCWPSAPDWSQLVEGERLAREGVRFESHWDERRQAQRTLRVGEDFDLVVLALGGGAIPHVTRELTARDERWRQMIDNLHTVPTQAFQLWMSTSMRELGWDAPPVNLSGFVEPFDTWADMSHLATEESWPTPPRSIAYFCSVLPDRPESERADPAYPKKRHDEVRENVVRFLERDIVHLWPRARDAEGHFRWDVLHGDPQREGAERVRGQFLTANVNPSDRYSLALPGTLRHRISPLDDRFDNLTIAGDWTACGFMEGCVEAAVMSGRLAAHALSGLPRLEDIIGFDHP